MSDPSWRVDQAEPETEVAGSGASGLVSLHFLLNVLRRRWRVWVGLGCAGVLIGAAWAEHKPPEDVGTSTLLLAHDPATDPVEAMATDISLLRTATVADNVIRRLQLHMSPYAFQSSVVAQEASTSVLVLEVSGPSSAAAVARAKALSDSYLTFRATQIRSQSDTLARGYEKRIAALRQQSQELSRQYDAARTSGNVGRASALLNKQSQVGAAIENAQQAIEDASLKTDFVIAASHVLDPPAAKPSRSAMKGLLLAVAAGLMGGAAIGVTLVIVMALVDDRLRLREEVALALDAPVRISVGRLQRRGSWWRPQRTAARRSRDVQLLVHAVEGEICRAQGVRSATTARPGRRGEMTRKAPSTRLALAATDEVEPARLVIAELAGRLSARGLGVFTVDLSETEGLEKAVSAARARHKDTPTGPAPVVYRPDGVPSLARGPVGLSPVWSSDPHLSDPLRASWESADVTLTLAEVDPAIGAEHVRSWAEAVVVVVTAGRSSGERLRTIADLIRSAGLRLPFAMLVGSDGTDNSAGLPETTPAPDPRYSAETSG